MEDQQYVGLDLHRRRSVLVRKDATGEVLETTQIVNDPLVLAEVIARAGDNPDVVLGACYGWVRHEALHDRAGCETPPAACRSRSLKLGGSLTSETRGRVGAASTTPGRASTARGSGFG